MRPLLTVACLLALTGPAVAQQTMLAAYDTNSDGVVDRTEFQAAQRDTFHRLDKDADGFVTAAELGGQSKSALKRDADGDGALTEAEFLSQAPGFTRVDRNRDGVLAGQELARLEKFMARG